MTYLWLLVLLALIAVVLFTRNPDPSSERNIIDGVAWAMWIALTLVTALLQCLYWLVKWVGLL